MQIKVKSRFVYRIKEKLTPNKNSNPEINQESGGFLILKLSLIAASLLSIFGAIVYRLYALNNIGIFLSLILSFSAFFIILRYNKKNNQKNQAKTGYFWDDLIFPGAYVLIALACFFLLFQARTDVALISPWEVVPKIFFGFYFLATVLLFLCIVLKTKFNLILLSIHYFLSLGVALIVYQLGYGFDAFIHEATMKLIVETGSVEPKPFYYLGFYSLIVIIHKLTFIPIAFLNKLIVPLLTSITIPVLSFYSFKSYFSNEKNLKLAILFLLILPFNIFILSTPQNLAFLFLFLIIILSLRKNKNDQLLITLLALSAFTIQPIAGIPAILFAIINTTYQTNLSIKIKKIILVSSFLLLCTALPLAFFISNQSQNSANPGEEISATSEIAPYLAWFKPSFPGNENFILNFIYLIGFNINLIFLALIIWEIYLARYFKTLWLLCLCPAIALISAYFFTSALNFDYLIAYERADFANRIVITACLFLIPFAFLSFYKITEKIFTQNKFIKTALFLFLLILVTSSCYLSYPRRDNFKNSHGVSTNINDIRAVNWIEKDASGQNYIVLANQQVSTAALHEFGFKKYYPGDIFFYPIPTGGPLYQYYLKMVYEKPNFENIKPAMDLAGVNLGYFVLNKYWWAFPRILDEAKVNATSWEKIGDGEVYVFKYVR